MLMPAGLAESEGLGLSLGALGVAAGAQKDTTWTKLFVGGLPYHTTDKSLREHFSVFGDIEEAVVITDRQTSKSRGYGFVIMGDRASAERACKDPNPIIDGRKANVNLAILGAKPRGNITQGFPFTAGIRAATGYPTAAVLPSQYGLPAGYVYGSPAGYVGSAAALGASGAGLVQLPQLQHAAAMAAATSHFYEYQAAAAQAGYQQQYAGFESYPYATAAAAAAAANATGYVSPYAAYGALPGTLPGGLQGAAGTLPGATGVLQGLPYPAQPTLQEARMQ